MTPREIIFLRHHGLPVDRRHLRTTDFNEWMRVVLCRARRDEPHRFTRDGKIRDHAQFTRWMAEAYPAKEVA